ncbi:hypothetical protein ACA910_018049 [Epithemia clementina (nom. ined.)]
MPLKRTIRDTSGKNNKNKNNDGASDSKHPKTAVGNNKKEQALEVFMWDARYDEFEPGLLKELQGVGVAQVAVSAELEIIEDEEMHLRLALTKDGKIRQWGPETKSKHSHCCVDISSFTEESVVDIACSGGGRIAAVTESGKLYLRGYSDNDNGLVDALRLVPKQWVRALDKIPVKQVACGMSHTVALSQSGKLYQWKVHGESSGRGSVLFSSIPLARDFSAVQISAGFDLTAAVTDTGKLYTWGQSRDGHGQLGHGTLAICHLPKQVESLNNVYILQVSVGYNHTAVVTSEGSVYVFGDNFLNQLGLPNKYDRRNLPTLLDELKDHFVVQVCCGHGCTSALTREGEVFFWGADKYEKPQKVKQLSDYRVVSLGATGCLNWALVEAVSIPPDEFSIDVSLRSLINDEEFSDVIFKVEGEQIHAHRVNLIRSRVFQAMFRSGMRESTVNGVIDIHDVSKQTFLLLLEYLYAGTVAVVPVELAFELWEAAELHGLRPLQKLCRFSVKDSINVENASDVLRMAEEASRKHSECIGLKKICLDFVVANYGKVSKTEGMRRLTDPALCHEIMNGLYSYYNMIV